jgi:hypothetical protein
MKSFIISLMLVIPCFSQQPIHTVDSQKGVKYFFQSGFGVVNTDQLHVATVDIMGNRYDFEDGSGMLLLDFRFGIRIKKWIAIVPYTTLLFAGYEVRTKYTDMGFPAKEKTSLIFLPGSAIRIEYFIEDISLVGECSCGPIIASPAFAQMTIKGTGPSFGFMAGIRYRVFELLLGQTGIPVKYCNTESAEYGTAAWKEINIGGFTLVLHVHFGS